MSFAIIISEKGGAERREVFDKNEIVVGRLQGNDLTLQKSNVSKKHVRLLFNAGRFIVADLESTNGTYVNGRKITKATIVREGDKIYVGDFVLRFEATPGAALAPESSPSAPGPREATPAELSQIAPAPREAVSHYPLEHDPDEGSNPRISIPAPPRLPSGLGASMAPRGGTQAIPQQPPAGPSTDASREIHALAQSVAQLPHVAGPMTAPHALHPAPPSAPRPLPSVATPVPSPKPSALGKESSGSNPRRLGVSALIDAIADRVDLSPLRAGTMPVEPLLAQRIEQALRESAPRLKQEGLLPETAEITGLIRDVQRELLGLGPLGQMLEEDDIHSIQIHRYDTVQVQRISGTSTSEPGFSSDEALRRTIARLCSHSQLPVGEGESLIERRLPQGNLIATLPPLSPAGCTLTFRKRRHEASADDPVRTGSISRVAWNFLLQCIGAHMGVLIISPAPLLLAPLLAASADERIAVLLPHDQALQLSPNHTAFQTPAAGATRSLGAAIQQMGFERLALLSLDEAALPALFEAAERAVAPLAVVRGTGLRHSLARLTASIAARASLSPELAREWLSGCFDLIVEVGRLRDGRLRVLRIAEVVGTEHGALSTRDIFLTVPERNGSGDSTLSPTGQIPRSLDDLRGRGFSVDPSIFERVSSR